MKIRMNREDIAQIIAQLDHHDAETVMIEATSDGLWFSVVGEGFSSSLGIIEKDDD